MHEKFDQKASGFWSKITLIFMISFIIIFSIAAFFVSMRVKKLRDNSKNQLNIADQIENSQRNKTLGWSHDDPSLGPKDAPILIVEFSDFQCPYCREATVVIKEILKRYDGKIHYIYRDFPVASIHPAAQAAAEAAQCADEQGRFWFLHDIFFKNQENITLDSLEELAEMAGVDVQKLSKCLSDQKYSDEVLADIRDGISLGVEGTPTFFINGYKIPGSQPVGVFSQIIEAELSESK